MDRNVSCYLCQISKMTGFAGVTPGLNMELVPTLTSGRTDADSQIAREADEADKAARQTRGEGDGHRAVGS